ncbi:putative AP2/ERF domain-containing transcription factor [Hibiscus syriacus]|uniref:AP2/ERF domain-containing transcription factor n=1 Tax=Hibiscus syriacus TaxID=106335 RepID=A0A6A2WQE1_HIBSY|nr:putative AP2/ERF domain-containing transcription factor [Hibiscus syriacus]
MQTLIPHLNTLHCVFFNSLLNPPSCNVRIAALSASARFIQCISNAKDRDTFQDMLSLMMQTLTEALNSGLEATAQEALELLIELAGTEPRFLRRQIVEVVGSMLQIAEADSLEEGTRHLAIEFIITLVEARERAPGMMRKLPQFIKSNYEVGQECLDRLAISLRGNTVVPVASELFPTFLSAPEWQKRHAALIALAQIAEGDDEKSRTGNFNGKVIRVFIPFINKRPKYKVSTFAFVHFASKEDMCNAIQKMNNVMVDGRRIFVIIAKYDKITGTRSRKGDRGEGSNSVETGGLKVRRPSSPVEVVGKMELMNRFLDGRTYKDTIFGVNKDPEGVQEGSHKNKEVKKPMEVFIPVEERVWLRSSLTGIYKAIFEVDFVQKAIWNEGFKAKVVRWGFAKNACLVVFQLEPVSDDGSIPFAYCAISMIGVPLNCWSVPFFTSLESRWGKLVKIQEETAQRVDCRVAHMLLRVESPFDIPEHIIINTYGRKFMIKIKVECFEDFFPVLTDMAEEDVSEDLWEENSQDWSQEDVQVRQEGQEMSPFRRISQKNLMKGEKMGRVWEMLPLGMTKLTGIMGCREAWKGILGLYSHLNTNSGKSVSVSKAERGFYNRVYSRSRIGGVKSCVGTSSDYVYTNEAEGGVEALECWNISKRVKARVVSSEENGRKILTGSAVSSAEGSAGGLITLWNEKEFDVQEEVIHRKFVAVKGIMEELLGTCWFINVYGPSVNLEKELFFEELLSFLENVDCPVCLGGDFNVVLSQEEKVGGAVNSVSMNVFRDFVSKANLVYLPLSGGRITWCNNREAPTFVRLDRFLVDHRFLSLFPMISQILQARSISDHNMILLENRGWNWGPKPIKMFNNVMEEDWFGEMMEELVNLCKLEKKKSISSVLKGVKEATKRWSRKGYLELPEKISRNELWKLHRREESIWLQRSRLKWIKDGDRNTKFSHLIALNRNRMNSILALRVADEEISDPEKLKKFVFEYFKENYNSKNTLEVEVINLYFMTLSEEQKNGLEVQFSEQEVREVVFHSDSSKAPGPDGFTMGFFKNFWPILKDHLMKFLDDFHRGMSWEHGVNHAFITLIPKKLNPEVIEDYRPISLVGSLYKIISRILSRRLVSVIKVLISPLQFAFILVLINGSPTQEFQMGKGLRQGCSLSPLLFNIVGELLNLMLSKATALGLFEGFNIGLHLNLSKSKLFGVNVAEDRLKDLALEAGCGVGSFPMTYLGLPIGTKKNSELLWEPVLQKVFIRLAGWKAASLSLAGRLVLIKSVLSSLPIFYLSIFKILFKVNQKINSVLARFLWGEEFDKKRVNWVNWSTVCQPLEEGGLGVLDLSMINRVLLWKWVWKYANDKDSQWKKLICCIHNVSIESLSIGKAVSLQDSWVWRGIRSNYEKKDEIGDCLRSNSNIQVGNDRSIDFWNDIWVNGSTLKIQFPRIFALSTNKRGKLVEFGGFVANGWVWNIQLRRNLCDWELDQWLSLMLLINNITPNESVADFLGWSGKGNGLFSVKSCRMTISSRTGGHFQWKKWVWSGLTPPRVDLLVGDSSLADNLPIKSYNKKKVLYWSPPPSDFFKFNVDGAVRGDGLQGGIGGVLKDSECSTLYTFSFSVGPGPPMLVELKAIKQGIDLFISCEWGLKGRPILETDCKTAVDWILLPFFAPTFSNILVGEIGGLVSGRGIIVRWIPRTCNWEADKLAKEVNGIPTEKIQTTRGLRQGCSLSPMLFNLGGELLHLLLVKAVDKGLFSGFKLAKNRIFGINVEEEVLASWAKEIGCSMGFFPSEYLGLSLGAKKNSFALKNICLRAGNGESVEFWHDVWLGLVPLKDRFPRLFALSNNKGGKVAEFRLNNASGWVWDIQVRRNLVDWEVEQWLQLISLLNSTTLSLLEEDCWIWLGNGEGCFSAKSCIKNFFDRDGNDGKDGVAEIDDPLCPMCGKCEESASHLFLHCEVVGTSSGRFIKLYVDGAMAKGWDKGGIGGLISDCRGIVLGSFSEKVMEVLMSLQGSQMEPDDPTTSHVTDYDANIDDEDDERYSFPPTASRFLPYGKGLLSRSIETITLGDKRIGIKTSVLEEKATTCNMLCCYADELKEGFFPWIDQVATTLVPLLKFYFHEEVRKAAVSAMPELLHSAKLAVEKGQSQAKHPSVQIQTDLLVGDPTRADSFLITSGPKNVIGWSPPPADMFKLNVDGAVTGDGMQGGIGGVLKDSFSGSLASFSSAIGSGLPILTELKAIKEGLGFFYSSNWAKKGRLIIESDCKCAVDWILKLQPAPSFFSDLVEDIEALITAKGVVLRWIPRSYNLEADRLAKQGIG